MTCLLWLRSAAALSTRGLQRQWLMVGDLSMSQRCQILKASKPSALWWVFASKVSITRNLSPLPNPNNKLYLLNQGSFIHFLIWGESISHTWATITGNSCPKRVALVSDCLCFQNMTYFFRISKAFSHFIVQKLWLTLLSLTVDSFVEWERSEGEWYDLASTFIWSPL